MGHCIINIEYCFPQKNNISNSLNTYKCYSHCPDKDTDRKRLNDFPKWWHWTWKIWDQPQTNCLKSPIRLKRQQTNACIAMKTGPTSAAATLSCPTPGSLSSDARNPDPSVSVNWCEDGSLMDVQCFGRRLSLHMPCEHRLSRDRQEATKQNIPCAEHFDNCYQLSYIIWCYGDNMLDPDIVENWSI